MTHGSHQYFIERTRFESRVSALTLAVAISMLSLLILVIATPLRDFVADPEHFGFEGPDRYVRRIELEAYGVTSGWMDVPIGMNYVPHGTRGHGGGDERAVTKEIAPQVGHGPLGPGDAPEDLLARAMRHTSDLPLVQSEDLVFLRLVRPTYPEQARKEGIEKRFSVLALIDTAGRVVQVQALSDEPNGILEREASAAASQWIVRPYRIAGTPREFVVRIPFNFLLRE